MSVFVHYTEEGLQIPGTLDHVGEDYAEVINECDEPSPIGVQFWSVLVPLRLIASVAIGVVDDDESDDDDSTAKAARMVMRSRR